jgi:hypothetical protein
VTSTHDVDDDGHRRRCGQLGDAGETGVHSDHDLTPRSDDAVSRGTLLDRFCAEIGRDPASITRSMVLPVSYDHPGGTRDAITEAIDAGFWHIVLSLHPPYPESAARWVADELIRC